MTENDTALLKAARKTSYWDFDKVFEMAKLSDSEVVAAKLRNIGYILREVDSRGYRF